MTEIDPDVLHDAAQLLRLLANESDPDKGTRAFARFTAGVIERRISEEEE